MSFSVTSCWPRLPASAWPPVRSSSPSLSRMTRWSSLSSMSSGTPWQTRWRSENMTFWSCNSCSSGNFLFFFELFAHWRECHDFNPNLLKYHYEKITLDNQIDRDVILAQDGWACQACEGREKFDHKFQLVSHWHKHHSNPDVTYEVCQWCSELFSSPECSTLVRAYYKKDRKHKIIY